GSIRNSTWPSFTSRPSSYTRSSSTPGTRARTSAERYGDRRPTRSRCRGTFCGCTSITPTSGGGGVAACSSEQAARASRLQARSRGRYIVMGRGSGSDIWNVSGTGTWRREGAQEAVYCKGGPAGARLWRVAVRGQVSLPVEIQADDHAQQQLRRAVRIVMPEQAPAHGLLQPAGQAVEQGTGVIVVHLRHFMREIPRLDGHQAGGTQGAGF